MWRSKFCPFEMSKDGRALPRAKVAAEILRTLVDQRRRLSSFERPNPPNDDRMVPRFDDLFDVAVEPCCHLVDDRAAEGAAAPGEPAETVERFGGEDAGEVALPRGEDVDG